MKNSKKSFWALAIVISILIIGAFIRFVNLTCLPPGIYPDEAMNTTDGLLTAEAGGWKWFYENNQGREGLYINILGYLLHWFGPSLWIVRFFPALMGALTLPAVYWLGVRLIGTFGGLIALSLTAFSYWHLNFSRIGFRALLMTFLLTWTFAFLIEGFFRLISKERKTFPYLFFIVSGLLLGLSLHTYIAVRIVPAVIIVLWVASLIFFWKFRGSILKGGLVFAFFACLSAAPMLWDFYKSPYHFTGRTSNVSVMQSPQMLKDLTKSISLTLASFLFYGDQNWRHNYPYLPLTLPFWGIILLWGVLQGVYYFLKNAFLKIFSSKGKESYLWAYFSWIFLIAWWLFFLLPSVMTNEGLPHALRSIGSLVPTYLLIGYMVERLSKTEFIRKIFIVLTILTAIINVSAYFFLWGKSPSAYSAFEYRLSAIGIYLRDNVPKEPQINFYVVTNQDSFRTDANLPVAMEPIRFFTWEIKDRVDFVLPERVKEKKISIPAKIIITQDNEAVRNEITQKFPQAKENKVKLGWRDTQKVESQEIYFGSSEKECFMKPVKGVEAEFIIYTVSQLP